MARPAEGLQVRPGVVASRPPSVDVIDVGGWCREAELTCRMGGQVGPSDPLPLGVVTPLPCRAAGMPRAAGGGRQGGTSRFRADTCPPHSWPGGSDRLRRSTPRRVARFGIETSSRAARRFTCLVRASRGSDQEAPPMQTDQRQWSRLTLQSITRPRAPMVPGTTIESVTPGTAWLV